MSSHASPVVTAPQGAAPPLIELRGLVKRHGGKTILDGVSFVVERGETIVVIGGSGAGKTTLARLVMGLDRPTSGQVLLDGVDLATLGDRALAAARRRFAMVFQSSALLDSMTVFDNIAFPLRETTDLDEAVIRERVFALLRELDIEHAADRMPAELSGGMAKRAGIARAMVTEPEILVYDEPTAGLDPITSRVVDGLVEHMRERFFVTSLVITHDMVTAYTIADRVILLERGRVVTDGPPERVFLSHSERIRPFALSSGVDLERLAKRAEHKPPAEIRAAWVAAHPPAAPEERPWYQRWTTRTAR